MRFGFNISAFFSEYQTPDGAILRSDRYFAFALESLHRITPNTTISGAYWNDNGQEPGTVSGHFLSVIAERTDISIGKSVLLAANIQLFYINYTGNSDGLFVSPKIASAIRNVPFSLYFQATQAIVSNIVPFPCFKWNLGLAYNF